MDFYRSSWSDSHRSATNAGSSMRTKFCVFRGRYGRQRTLVIRIAAITLASDSAITLARFRPSKIITDCSLLPTLSLRDSPPLLPSHLISEADERAEPNWGAKWSVSKKNP